MQPLVDDDGAGDYGDVLTTELSLALPDAIAMVRSLQLPGGTWPLNWRTKGASPSY